jgi:hypothetical protein
MAQAAIGSVTIARNIRKRPNIGLLFFSFAAESHLPPWPMEQAVDNAPRSPHFRDRQPIF